MEPMTILIIVFSVALALGVGLSCGLLLEIRWQAKLLRKLTKKDYGILSVVSKDRKTIRRILVNFSKEIVDVKDKKWVIEAPRIYREDQKEKGDNFSSKIKYEEGIPIAFVDEKDILALDFFKKDIVTSPEVISSIIGNFANYEIERKKASIGGMDRTQMLVILSIVLITVAIALAWYSYTNTQTIAESLAIVQSQMGVQ